MRVATFVLGVSLIAIGGVSEASENVKGPAAHRAAAVLADGVIASPAVSPLRAVEGPSTVMLTARDAGVRHGLGVIAFIPTQNPAWLLRASPNFGEPRPQTFDPARIPLPAKRTGEDHLLTGFIAVMLIAYQLRRKHRFLRPHQFST